MKADMYLRIDPIRDYSCIWMQLNSFLHSELRSRLLHCFLLNSARQSRDCSDIDFSMAATAVKESDTTEMKKTEKMRRITMGTRLQRVGDGLTSRWL